VNAPANTIPSITATAASNGSVVIVPSSVPGTATVTVTSEDGSTSQTYTLQLDPTYAQVGVGGSVASTLALSVGSTAPNLGAFVAGVGQTYTASLVATVTSTAATATLSAADASTVSPGHLVNTAAAGGPYALTKGLQVDATDNAPSPSSTGSGTFWDLSAVNPAALLSYSAPVANDPVTLGFQQVIGATDPLRTGTYSKTITFTLSTNTP
jgi:hypothetical protein